MAWIGCRLGAFAAPPIEKGSPVAGRSIAGANTGTGIPQAKPNQR